LKIPPLEEQTFLSEKMCGKNLTLGIFSFFRTIGFFVALTGGNNNGGASQVLVTMHL